ncbi:hypothetical protein R3P38DRAFT_2764955 [Favolaschia claudopus]|uniref:Uncharacterized protein n=1 Tax=Favolaschia claudopus TaxID=2862362 RepID=A0AAW0D9Q7_9AGAR
MLILAALIPLSPLLLYPFGGASGSLRCGLAVCSFFGCWDSGIEGGRSVGDELTSLEKLPYPEVLRFFHITTLLAQSVVVKLQDRIERLSSTIETVKQLLYDLEEQRIQARRRLNALRDPMARLPTSSSQRQALGLWYHYQHHGHLHSSSDGVSAAAEEDNLASRQCTSESSASMDGTQSRTLSRRVGAGWLGWR